MDPRNELRRRRMITALLNAFEWAEVARRNPAHAEIALYHAWAGRWYARAQRWYRRLED